MNFLTLALSTLLATAAAHAEISVFAAASTTDVMKELAAAFEKEGGKTVRFNFASSGALARQISAGAPADVFVSANAEWMDWLEEKKAVETETLFNLAANTLVMVAPAESELVFDKTIKGRIAVGDFKSVPAGMYAEEALIHMGWLEDFKPNLVMASNVRTALLYVERGETAAGIVYSTDAKRSGKVKMIGTFPVESHSPIIYPAVAVSEKESVLQFLEFLKSETARAILIEHGFTEPE